MWQHFKVRILLARPMEAGSHQLVWDGRNESGRQVASGTYVVDIKAGGFNQTLKATVAKQIQRVSDLGVHWELPAGGARTVPPLFLGGMGRHFL